MGWEDRINAWGKQVAYCCLFLFYSFYFLEVLYCSKEENEFKKHLDNTFRHMVSLLGIVLCRELDSVIPVGPFQLSMFCEIRGEEGM